MKGHQPLGLGDPAPGARPLLHDPRPRRRRRCSYIESRPRGGSVLRRRHHGGRRLLAGRHARRHDERAHQHASRRSSRRRPTSTSSRASPRPASTVIYVQLRDSTPPSATSPTTGTRCGRRSPTSSRTCPTGREGPFFNDEFGDVFGIIYGVTFDGFSLARGARLRRDGAQGAFLGVPDVGKVEIFGDQDEKVYLTFSPEQLAALNLNLNQIMNAIADAERGDAGRRDHHHERGHPDRRSRARWSTPPASRRSTSTSTTASTS